MSSPYSSVCKRCLIEEWLGSNHSAKAYLLSTQREGIVMRLWWNRNETAVSPLWYWSPCIYERWNRWNRITAFSRVTKVKLKWQCSFICKHLIFHRLQSVKLMILIITISKMELNLESRVTCIRKALTGYNYWQFKFRSLSLKNFGVKEFRHFILTKATQIFLVSEIGMPFGVFH